MLTLSEVLELGCPALHMLADQAPHVRHLGYCRSPTAPRESAVRRWLYTTAQTFPPDGPMLLLGSWPSPQSRPRAAHRLRPVRHLDADCEDSVTAVDASQGRPPTAAAGATAAISNLRAAARAASRLGRVCAAFRPARLRCLIAGHDDRFSRDTGRLALVCNDCGRRTAGWTIGPSGPGASNRLVSRRPIGPDPLPSTQRRRLIPAMRGT
jgi:hypothetical protein